MNNIEEGVLYKTKSYLCGHMEYSNGRDWRDDVTKELSELGITCLNPYNKPFLEEVQEDETHRASLNEWMQNEEYDKVSNWMSVVRKQDLKCVDICDFVFCRILPKIASWGSAEELAVAERNQRPVFLVVEGGKKLTPLWLMSMFPHKYIYNSIEEALDMIKQINNNQVPIDSNRWKLLRPEYR